MKKRTHEEPVTDLTDVFNTVSEDVPVLRAAWSVSQALACLDHIDDDRLAEPIQAVEAAFIGLLNTVTRITGEELIGAKPDPFNAWPDTVIKAINDFKRIAQVKHLIALALKVNKGEVAADEFRSAWASAWDHVAQRQLGNVGEEVADEVATV